MIWMQNIFVQEKRFISCLFEAMDTELDFRTRLIIILKIVFKNKILRLIHKNNCVDLVFLFMRFHSMTNSFFIWKMIYFLENNLESSLIFVLFLKGKQNKKENPKCDLILEKVICEKLNMDSKVRLLIGKVR